MRCILSCALLLLTCVASPAADKEPSGPNTLTPQEITDGWILLFDGQTTFGWRSNGNAKAADAVLTISGDKDAAASLTTRFGSFDLRFECKGSGKFTMFTDNGRGSTALGQGDQWQDVDVVVRHDPAQPPGSWNISNSDGKSRVSYHSGPPGIQFEAAAGQSLSLRNVKLKPIGTKSIFNGKDLTGWKVVPGHKSKFSVNNKGELNIKDGNGDIQTEGQWDDFVLQLEIFSNGAHLNSGVFFRCLPGEFWSGYEAQIRNEWISDVVLKDGTKVTGSYTLMGDVASVGVFTQQGNRWRATREKRKLAKSDIQEVIDHRDQPIDYGTGAIYNRQAARKVVSNDYEWYTMTVAAHGNHIATWVNGYPVADFTDTRPNNKSARNGRKDDKGPISLQGHDPTTDLNFRNIRIAELPRK